MCWSSVSAQPTMLVSLYRYERDRDCPPGMRALPLPTAGADAWLCKHCLHQRHALACVQDPPNWPTAILQVLWCRPGESLDAAAIWACMKEAKWTISQGLGEDKGRAWVLSTCLKVCSRGVVFACNAPCCPLQPTNNSSFRWQTAVHGLQVHSCPLQHHAGNCLLLDL